MLNFQEIQWNAKNFTMDFNFIQWQLRFKWKLNRNKFSSYFRRQTSLSNRNYWQKLAPSVPILCNRKFNVTTERKSSKCMVWFQPTNLYCWLKIVVVREEKLREIHLRSCQAFSRGREKQKWIWAKLKEKIKIQGNRRGGNKQGTYTYKKCKADPGLNF